jgi:hypothetical protein
VAARTLEGVPAPREAVAEALGEAPTDTLALALPPLLAEGVPVAASVAEVAAEALGETLGVPPPRGGAVGVGQAWGLALVVGERVVAAEVVGLPVPAAALGEAEALPALL